MDYKKSCKLIGKYVKNIDHSVIFDHINQPGYDYNAMLNALQQEAVQKGLVSYETGCSFLGDCLITIDDVEYQFKYSFPYGLHVPSNLNKNVLICSDSTYSYSKNTCYSVYDRLYVYQNALPAEYVLYPENKILDPELVSFNNLYSVKYDGQLYELKTIDDIMCYVPREGRQRIYCPNDGLVYFD